MKEVVSLTGGAVRGQRLDGGETVCFRGIPYAAPPVGQLRWRPPQPCDPWSGIRDATRFGAIPIQRERSTRGSLVPVSALPQSEDCLFLNVWTAADSSVAELPVIVWLHPGGFQFGSGSEPISEGPAWARAGAVFVSLNFRLSKTGFLTHPALSAEEGTTGNYGLLDQISALRWVRDNIAEFGGDPHCVTLYGVSSGATSISLLMNSAVARGLFHRAIAESGGSFGPVGPHTGVGDCWQDLEGGCSTGQAWASAFGAKDVAGLRALSADRIRAGSVPHRNTTADVFDAARPIVDGLVIPDGSRSRFESGDQAPVPLLVGCAANEDTGTVTYAGDLAGFLEQASHDLGDELTKFLRLYPARTDEEAVAASLRANGHRLFTWQTWMWARLHAQAGFPVYYYRFEQPLPVPPGRYPQQRIARPLGAFHGGSLYYTFDQFGLRSDWPWSEEDRSFGRTMRAAWVEFARTGRPSHEQLPCWPEYDPAEPTLMALSVSSELVGVPDRDYLAFWDRFYGRQQPEIGGSRPSSRPRPAPSDGSRA